MKLKQFVFGLCLATFCAGTSLQEQPAQAAGECPAGNTKWAHKLVGGSSWPANCRIDWCRAYATTYSHYDLNTPTISNPLSGYLVAKYELVNGTAPANNCPQPFYSTSQWIFPK